MQNSDKDMITIKKKYSEILKKIIKLKNSFYANGIKLEFETEFVTQKDIYFAKKLALESGLDLAIKIGGCGSVHDIEQAEKISPQSIVAPMIESRYSLEKFFSTAQILYDIRNIDLYLNLETICGYNNLDEILSSFCISEFKGIVFGRSDFVSSLNLSTDYVNSKLVLDFVNNVTQKIEKSNLELILGGCVSSQSKEFLENIKSASFKQFETRKIIFDKKLLSNDFEQGLELALEFELDWLNLKGQKTILDKNRIEEITKRLNKFALV